MIAGSAADRVGFEFAGWNWRWADVGDFEPVVGGFPNRAITHGPPVSVPVAFDAGERSLDGVLRAPLQSYRDS